jgi:hypothetical protein
LQVPGSKYSPEEWSIVAEAPLVAGARVVAAERGGTIRESLAVGRVYSASRELHGESALLDELVASPPSIELRRIRAIDDPVAASNERLRAALAILAQKATLEDLDAYKGFVLAVAQSVAEAHREGGFAGIGGEEVSEREQAALDQISAVLGQ